MSPIVPWPETLYDIISSLYAFENIAILTHHTYHELMLDYIVDFSLYKFFFCIAQGYAIMVVMCRSQEDPKKYCNNLHSYVSFLPVSINLKYTSRFFQLSAVECQQLF